MDSRSSLLSVLAMVVTGLLALGLAAGAAEEDSNPSTTPKVNLRTTYLTEAVGRAHQIAVAGQLGGEGKVTLDGNTCTTNQFGDKQVCTKILFRPIDVEIKRLRLADPSGLGRRIFRLDGDLEPKGAAYFLVVPPRRSGAHRLVVNLDGDRRRVITLEAVAAATSTAKPKPELCRTGKFRAEQAQGIVTIFGNGENPTAGWKVGFEQLPIRIFPPQFRLVCVPPAGPAAQVITPFEVKTSFKAEQAVREVIVHNAKGQHKVPVKQSGE